MSGGEVRKIADAILYEGYALYPYRTSNVKNRHRWTFGSLYPEAFAPRTGDRSSFQTQVLIACSSEPVIEVSLRFLHLIEEQTSGQGLQTGVEREIRARSSEQTTRFSFPARKEMTDAASQRQEELRGVIEMRHEPVAEGVEKLTVRVVNLTDLTQARDLSREEASLYALVSAHAVLNLNGGEFISLTDPPEGVRALAADCEQKGVWPVLAGEPGSQDCMLVSPIILSDYPQVAPESAGDLFDSAEIDEILTLRILTLTDAEKNEMRSMDERTRRILARTEGLSHEQLMRLHGTLRNPHAFASGSGGEP